MAKKRLGEVLQERRQISPETLENAIQEQKKKLLLLGELLLEGGAVSKPALVSALEEVTGVAYLDARVAAVNEEVLPLVPRALVEEHCALPLRREGKHLVVVMAEPQNLRALDELRFAAGSEIAPRLGFREEIREAVARCYPRAPEPRAEVVELAGKLDPEQVEFFTSGTSQRHAEAIREFQRELRSDKTPAVQIVSAILAAAAAKNASDAHMEQQPLGTLVRIRVDGVLRDLTRIPAGLRNSVISRVKILCDMDISERRVPQDGRLLARIGDTQYDLRVSTLPTQYGEKINIRLLDPAAAQVSFADLGMSEEQAQRLGRLLSQPQGMLLVTGPTGSGKSTTLYGALNHLRSPSVSILTIEDPVEYLIEGVNQVQVNPRAGRTFANCLRSMLRQDPNIIMVGEIRDGETAEIALQTAQTGHLVLSTLHTNDSIGAITRLLDLEQPGFLIASSVTAVMAQRLVRRVCSCRRLVAPTLEQVTELAGLGWQEVPERMVAAMGCEACDQTGYRKRVGVFEMLEVNDGMRRAICGGGREDELRALARSQGMKSMQQDALEKVREGLTTLEEVSRVVPFENLHADRCYHCSKALVSTFVYCPHCATQVQREGAAPRALVPAAAQGVSR